MTVDKLEVASYTVRQHLASRYKDMTKFQEGATDLPLTGIEAVLSSEDLQDLDFINAAKYVMSPPIRASGHDKALQAALSTGNLQLVGTDHCAFNSTQKAFGINDFRTIPNGVNGIEERMHLERSNTCWICFFEEQGRRCSNFPGTTRDTFDGKTVLELRCEAYVPMAILCINDICSSARASWSLLSIAVAHRLGPVPVGETSVFIAISSVHRADALDACKFVIDEIKAPVPIWEKEVYANGEVWKENSEFLERGSKLGSAGLQ
ncbi:uncharacterized protein LOC109123673 [Vitis vinifera]|uniref:uncharacterized protein LOC109123673 n=1 Tax=Vitis vinifera TaxID=29760 RepID=UPI002883161C|nr:uncharacterized protein LOC109123673 [Vitis vinifera]